LAATAAPPSTLGLAKSVEFFGYRGGSVRASAVLGNNTCSGGSHLDCPDEYMYNVSVTFANHLADTAVLSRLVRVQVPILGVRIVTNATHYKTNAIVSFYVLQHQGSQPLYTWNFTDGTRTGPELQQQWNFTSPGPRTVQTESTNYISGNWSNI
uniref:PKD domain-containing protein n=2 Tax=Macrostomum lignano TaxID=282301 RepID=A0A1I8GIJ7_9PLAT